jgi:hypothetical protein
VTPTFPGQSTPPHCFSGGRAWYGHATTVYSPNRHGAARGTVCAHQPGVGFNAKYQSGATVPTGQTEFQVQDANLNFHSTSYDWLVVTRPKFQYQGSGTINGSGSFGFLLTGWDGSAAGGSGVDKFRIKIWDKNNTNAVVYDSQMGAATSADPTTVLGSGNLRIHSNPQLARGVPAPDAASPEAVSPPQLPPIIAEAIDRWAAAGISPDEAGALSRVEVNIGHLPPGYLGLAFPGAIWIDQDAAGFGWFIDPTPGEDSEFANPGTGPAVGRMDLLTVVVHELGHELGLGDVNADDSVMGVALPAGVRRMPTARDLAPDHAENPAWWVASGTGTGPQLGNFSAAPAAGALSASRSWLDLVLLSEALLPAPAAFPLAAGTANRPQDLPLPVRPVAMLDPAPAERRSTPSTVPVANWSPGEFSVVVLDRLFADPDGSLFAKGYGGDPLSVTAV